MMDSHNQGVRSTANPFKVLIAGGCYSGLAAAINLLDKCDSALDARIPVSITILDERSGFCTPRDRLALALSSKEYADKCWVDFADVKILQRPDVRFVHGRVQKVDPATRTATILGNPASEQPSTEEEKITYDYFVAATGLRRVWPVVPQSLTRKTYLHEAGRHIDAVRGSAHPVLVVGGGAVGIEMAAELKMVQPDVRVTLAHSRDKLLSAEPLPDDVKDRALELVREAGVDTLMNHRLLSALPLKPEPEAGYEVEFTNGNKMTASVVIEAISRSVPSTDYLPRAALAADGSGLVRIRPTMQILAEETEDFPDVDRHFAVGDLIHWSGIKRCGAAMHEGKFAGLNIHQLMLQELSSLSEKKHTPEFQELAEIAPMIGLAVGRKGLSYGPGEGMKSGEDVLKVFFEDDLGFRIVWDYLRLGKDPVKV
ncbi:pyridine nucleotide-disulfide oxidoreductase-like protein [Apiospora phragmitis]|uniref:Pyridine nucleotide-disulfide oxidoreductase-like protein n=1 Tax=Apiospora phragmitis TaxID=2905665 RepID=A0ABR1W262_9PEZI